jgi:hypothetical protein
MEADEDSRTFEAVCLESIVALRGAAPSVPGARIETAV